MSHSLQIAVVDDLLCDRERISARIAAYAEDHHQSWQVTCFSSGEEFLSTLPERRYAIVFLDILMTGINGIETARRLRKEDPDAMIVFVTTEADYAVDGYEVEAAGFLLKEDSRRKNRFDQLMQRLTRHIFQDVLLELPRGGASLQISAGDILYAEVLDHAMHLHTKSDVYILRMTMDELKPALPQDGRFFECHRGIVVNLDTVVALGGQVIRIENGDTLPVSRRKRSELEHAYAARSISRVRGTL